MNSVDELGFKPINDRLYIQCSAEHCCRFDGHGSISVGNGRIVEQDSDCKKCDTNLGLVEVYYKPEFEMVEVTSSNISHVGYRETDQTLRVKFSSKATYEYAGVPEELVKQLMSAESVGSFFSKNIRNQWQGKKLAG